MQLRLISKALNEFEKKASVGERTKSAKVDVSYELPIQAVTEAIVNAVVHRDYVSNGSVQVMLFKNRLEVWNPGRLPQGVTVANLSQEHKSIPVNPILARPVYLAGYIEQLGTGTTDLIKRCIDLDLRRPEFRQDENFLSILWRKGAEATEGTASQETGNVKRVVLAVGALCFAEESRLKEIPAFADDEMRTALDSSAFNVRTRHWIPAWRSERLAQKTPP